MAVLQFNDLSMVPPGGWEFEQPEMGWKAPNPVQDGFWKLVDMIVQLRQNNRRFNLPTDRDLVALEVQAFNCPKVPRRCRGYELPQPVVSDGVIYETRRRKGCGGCGR